MRLLRTIATVFAEVRANDIGRITPLGDVRESPVPGMVPVGIASGPDGAMWFTGFASNEIGRITLDGVVERFAIPTLQRAFRITSLPVPDGALWFTEQQSQQDRRLEPSHASTG